MPGLIKIGKTEQNTDVRLSQLYTTGVPVPFKCVMAVEPDRPAVDVEKALHQAFEPQRLNPSREFFEVEPEHVLPIMQLLGKDVTDQVQAADDSKLTESDKTARERADRRPPINFRQLGLEPGTELRFKRDEKITITVVDERKVRIGDDVVSPSEATKRALDVAYLVKPGPYWLTKRGELLQDIYDATHS